MAADFDDDGWPDLYAPAWQAQNRLFLNQGDGTYADATSSEIGDTGRAHGVAVGDVDNDGDIDLFQASGGDEFRPVEQETPWRSYLLLNLGEGRFIDVSEGAGLSLGTDALANAQLADMDNDGDLDLLTGLLDSRFSERPLRFFVNLGDGTFEDRSSDLGVDGPADVNIMQTVDYDGDGSLEIILRTRESLMLLGRRTDNHWLEVELVGTQSNRNGIGARIEACAGSNCQVRQLLGGTGIGQAQLVAHFGLGQHERIDQVTVQWPSGQVDVVTEIPANQKVRLFEGRSRWHTVEPRAWDPEPVVQGERRLRVRAGVRPGLFEPDARITGVTADLSAFGGPDSASLVDEGAGRFSLDASFEGLDEPVGEVAVTIEQETSVGPHWVRLSKLVEVTAPATSVTERHVQNRPHEFALHPSYPNPVNAEATIRFELARAGRVDLVVYDLAGQRVAALVRGDRAAGTYTARWDAKDDTGRDLASGVYIFRLSAGDYVESRKLTLLR